MRNTLSIAATAVITVITVFFAATVIVSSNARSMVVAVDDVEADVEYANETINGWSWARWPSANEF